MSTCMLPSAGEEHPELRRLPKSACLAVAWMMAAACLPNIPEGPAHAALQGVLDSLLRHLSEAPLSPEELSAAVREAAAVRDGLPRIASWLRGAPELEAFDYDNDPDYCRIAAVQQLLRAAQLEREGQDDEGAAKAAVRRAESYLRNAAQRLYAADPQRPGAMDSVAFAERLWQREQVLAQRFAAAGPDPAVDIDALFAQTPDPGSSRDSEEAEPPAEGSAGCASIPLRAGIALGVLTAAEAWGTDSDPAVLRGLELLRAYLRGTAVDGTEFGATQDALVVETEEARERLSVQRLRVAAWHAADTVVAAARVAAARDVSTCRDQVRLAEDHMQCSLYHSAPPEESARERIWRAVTFLWAQPIFDLRAFGLVLRVLQPPVDGVPAAALEIVSLPPLPEDPAEGRRLPPAPGRKL